MLPRKNLIPLRREFKRIRKSGKLYDSPSFGLLVSYGKVPGRQAAFIVSKKVDKKSVVRHEIKRKLADAVDPFLNRIPQNTELVFLAKTKAATTARIEITQEVEKILHRAQLLS